MMSNTFKELLYVFIGGGIGSSLRFSTGLMASYFHLRPWLGTLAVNVIGAIVMLILSFKYDLSNDSSRLLKTGVLGGLTTFSTFSLEVVGAFKSGNTAEGISILLLNIFLGVVVGIWIFR